MNDAKSRALNGASNQRINKVRTSDNESTAAWTGTDHNTKNANVSIPKSSAVTNAKEWVDNGSRLQEDKGKWKN